MRRCLLISCVVLLSLLAWLGPASAQPKPGQSRPGQARLGIVSGTVADSVTGKPLLEASVSLLSPRDSSLLTFQITGGEGNFSIRNVAEGAYLLQVTYVGYQSLLRPIRVDNALLRVGTLSLRPRTTTLNEVVVKEDRAPVTIKNDTLEFNAGSFKTRPDAPVEDLLKKLPGMEVARDGTIKAQGQEVKKVLVDGKPFFGNDPKVATRNLPADMIDRIQLYDKQSDQSAFSGIDDGDRDKTINLITRKDRRKGHFGQGTAGKGTDDRFAGRFNLNRFNASRQLSLLGMGNNINQQGFTTQDGGSGSGFGGGGQGAALPQGRGGAGIGGSSPATQTNITRAWAGGANYADVWGKKWDVSGSYFFNNANVLTDQQSRRQNILPQTGTVRDTVNASLITDQSFRSVSNTNNHRINVNLTYKLDSLNSIRFTPNFSWVNSAYSSLSQSRATSAAGALINTGNTDYYTRSNGVSGTNNILFMHKFRRRGRTLSANLSTTVNDQTGDGLNRSTNTFYRGTTPTMVITNQRNSQLTNALTNALTIAYTEPISLGKTLETHYNYSRNNNTSDRVVVDFNEQTGQYDRPNTRLSNRFLNTFTTNRAGLTYQNKRLKYTYAVGVDVQNAELFSNNQTRDSSINRQYMNLLPNALFTYTLAKNRTLRVNYRSRINAPSVTQLQPVADNTNPLSIRLGSPDLKPEYSNTVNVNVNSFNPTTFRSLFALLIVNQTNRKIVNSTSFNAVGAQTTKPVNVNGYYSVAGSLVFGRPAKLIGAKSNVNLSTNLNYNRGISLVNDQPNRSNNLSVGQGLTVSSTFNDKVEFSFGGNVTYQSASYSLQPQQNTTFLNTSLTNGLFWQVASRWRLNSDFVYTNNTSRSAGYNQSFALWNLSVSHLVFKKKDGELKLYVYDALNQNRSLVRNVTDTYIEDVQSQVLKRYFMLSFTYNLRNFAGTAPRTGRPFDGQSPGNGSGGGDGRGGRAGRPF